jgi:dihydroxyacid dehydratase/phosphogluconate dehydratase
MTQNDTTSTPCRRRRPDPAGELPLSAETLLTKPSGDVFALSQNAGMGWNPAHLNRREYLLLSTQGGMRRADGTPIALGYHTGHWEVGTAHGSGGGERSPRSGGIPFAGYVSDPCDGRSQGTPAMMDSLPVPERRGDGAAPPDPLAAEPARRARDRDLRQGASRR